ncbi:MAG TPA: GNAT family N-acetyltransferase [Actinomycetota bacterium]|nr:GNAT family N-acetyltransferase [Actinomycetota bacterium]
MNGVLVDPMRPDDWPAVREIYEEGIAGGNATFEMYAPTWDAWNRARLRECRLVAREEREGRVLGWVALSPVSERAVYRGVAELSIYVAVAARGRGVGRALLHRLIADSELAGIWTLQAGVLAENEASLALHRACGFREVGRRERIGRHGDVWRDVVLLERRSPTVGV